MKIAVASGKGGTGKTSVTVNLARVVDRPVTVVDCDVEEPNAHIFLKGEAEPARPVTTPLPVIDAERCDGCRACADFCAYNALICFGQAPLVFADLCHGCGGCALVCPRGAIGESERRIGEVRRLQSGELTLIEGRLDVGAAMPVPVIKAAKAAADGDLVLYDAPPGTSCPVVATLQGADYALLVTEPTRFGLNDLRLAVEVLRTLALPFGVVVNRAVAGETSIRDYCRAEAIDILAEIPDDRRIAEAYAGGRLIVEALPAYRPLFRSLLESCLSGAKT